MTEPTLTTTADAAVAETAAERPTTTELGPLPHPRIRTGAVVWGLLVAGIALGALVLQTSLARRPNVVDALASATPLHYGIGVLLVVGASTLLIAGVAIVRRAQIRRGGSE